MTDSELKTLKDNLWHAADVLRAGAHLAANKYGQPILGLIFLRYADILYKQYKAEIEAEYNKSKGTRAEKSIKDISIKYCGFYLPPEAYYTTINDAPDDANKATLVKKAMAFDAEEIRSFDGVFGVELSEWETVKDLFAPPDYEKAFLSNPADSFIIYQLRDNDNTAQLRFMNAEYLAQKGLSIEKGNYAAVYAGNLDRRGDTQDRLDVLYETFNIRRPEDFRGHSLSVSDIVALKQNGVVSCHYVDSRGFKALPDFLKPENYLKNAEMAMEDDYGMIDGIINNGPKQSTVADLEAQVKAGFSISLTELAAASHREQKKPSVLEKLREKTPEQTKNKTAPKRSAEREL